jgi:hypothetical protein
MPAMCCHRNRTGRKENRARRARLLPSAIGAGQSLLEYRRRAISVTVSKSKGMGRERSEWGCSFRAHLGQGRLGDGDRQGRPSSAQEQRREVGNSGGCAARQGREDEVAGEVRGAVGSGVAYL